MMLQIFLLFLFLKEDAMKDCYKVITASEVDNILDRYHKGYKDYDRTIKPMNGLVFNLDTQRILYIIGENHGLLFENEACLNAMLEIDRFPVDNRHRQYYDYHPDIIRNIHKKYDELKSHLENRLNIKDAKDKDTFYEICRLMREEEKKEKASTLDLVAFICIVGERVRAKSNCKWLIRKHYSGYNPSFIPMLLTPDERIAGLEGSVFSFLREDDSDPNQMIDRILLYMKIDGVNNKLSSVLSKGFDYRVLE
jgi:hypothetical protein